MVSPEKGSIGMRTYDYLGAFNEATGLDLKDPEGAVPIAEAINRMRDSKVLAACLAKGN